MANAKYLLLNNRLEFWILFEPKEGNFIFENNHKAKYTIAVCVKKIKTDNKIPDSWRAELMITHNNTLSDTAERRNECKTTKKKSRFLNPSIL